MHIIYEASTIKSDVTVEKWDRDYDFFASDGCDIFVYGYPYSEEEKCWLKAGDLHGLYLKYGLDFAVCIEGIYTIIINCKSSKKTFIITDRYGVYTMFYYRDMKRLIISDIIGEIVPYLEKAELNRDSIMEYLSIGQKFGSETHIKDIYELEYGAIYEIDEKLRLSKKQYWSYIDNDAEKRVSYEEFLTLYNDHIGTAAALNDRIVLPLTGGLDSRTILSACIHKKDRLHCYTHAHGTRTMEDVRVARKICSHYGIVHSTYKLTEEWVKKIPELVMENAGIFNGLVPTVNYMHVLESYKKEALIGELLISGAMGSEVWRSDLNEKVKHCHSIDDLCLRIINYYVKNPNILNIYKGLGRDDTYEMLKSLIKSEYHSYKKDDDLSTFSNVFAFIMEFQNHAGDTIKAAGKYFNVIVGFANRKLLSQIALMEPTEREHGLIQKYIIEKNDSYLLNIPLDGGRNISKNYVFKAAFTFKKAKAYLKKNIKSMLRSLLNSKSLKTHFFTEYPDWFRTYHRDFLCCILNYDDMHTKELFKKEELNNVVQSFLNGDNLSFKFIFYLMSLEVWLDSILPKSKCLNKEIEELGA